jgi:hypothetical protein
MKKIALLFTALLSACANNFETANNRFMMDFDRGNFKAAAENIKSAGTADDARDEYLYNLQCGAGYLWANDTKNAEICFDSAGVAAKDKDAKTEYRPLIYEQIMLKTYSGANDIIAKNNTAGVMFNQAYALQSDSVQLSGTQISELSNELEKKSSKIPGMPSIDSIVRDAETELNKTTTIKAMSDFVNPYTTWLSAIYYGFNGDLPNSENYLNRVKIFAPNNKFISNDFNTISSGEKSVWIILEDGAVGHLRAKSIAPQVLQSLNIKLTIPDILPGTNAINEITIKSNGTETKTQPLADMTRIAATDLKKYRRENIIKSTLFEIGKLGVATGVAVGSAVIANNQAKKQNNVLAFDALYLGLGAAGAVMSAEKDWDLRGWWSLPNTVSVARIQMPQNHKLELKIGDKTYPVEIEKRAKNAIIFVRMPSTYATPAIIQATLN